jgi:ATP-dependent Clp protease ATP-binding subunit ClpA
MMASIGNHAKEAGRELIIVIDEAHEIVQAKMCEVCEVCNPIAIY